LPRIVSRGERGGLFISRGSIGSALNATPGGPVGEHVDPEDLRRQQRNDHPQERSGEHHHDLRHASRQPVPQEGADVRVDPSPLLDRHDHGAQLVVGQHQVCRLARDLGAGVPHRHADVRGPQRRRVVDTVAGDRDHVTARLQVRDDRHLLLRPHPREDTHLARVGRGEHVVEPPTVNHRRGVPEQTESGRRDTCGARMVAGDRRP